MRLIPLAVALALALALPAMSRADTQEPPHEVLVEDGDFQIRTYKPMIVAEVLVTGDMQRAGSSGFRRFCLCSQNRNGSACFFDFLDGGF